MRRRAIGRALCGWRSRRGVCSSTRASRPAPCGPWSRRSRLATAPRRARLSFRCSPSCRGPTPSPMTPALSETADQALSLAEAQRGPGGDRRGAHRSGVGPEHEGPQRRARGPAAGRDPLLRAARPRAIDHAGHQQPVQRRVPGRPPRGSRTAASGRRARSTVGRPRLARAVHRRDRRRVDDHRGMGGGLPAPAGARGPGPSAWACRLDR